ncbi:MAG: Lon protease, partial [Epulopiscium sp. Nele67-Bin002]
MNYILIAIQLFFTLVMGTYFFMQIDKEKSSRVSLNEGSDKKFDEIQQLRKTKLTPPLTEKMRPKAEQDIIGQTDGLQALKIALCAPNPQHIIIYGSPGVGKTAAARIALDMAKSQSNSPFRADAPFIELDATTLRFDERSIADPLIGSVHDPIYQGAGAYGNAGVPQPKQGAVTDAHGGVLFIDEIGELNTIQMNKLLKVLEDRKVHFESAYYSAADKNTPKHIHDIFANGLPADFRLIGATTRKREELPAALRSRCVEISFNDLNQVDIKTIVKRAIAKDKIHIDESAINLIAKYSNNGREAITILQTALNKMKLEQKTVISTTDLEWVLQSGGYSIVNPQLVDSKPYIGKINGLGVVGQGKGMILDIQCVVKKTDTPELKITGIIEEEQLKHSNSTFKRKSLASSSLENVITLMKTMYDVSIEDYFVHINFPADVPIDGPSAGVAMFCCLYSAIFDKPINSNIAITGKITIHGDIYAVGKVTEKIQAAKEAGVKTVFIPKDNMQQSYDDYIGINVIPVSHIQE